MSNQISLDTSPSSRGLQTGWQRYTKSTGEEQGQDKKDISFHTMWLWFDDDDMLFKVSCAACYPFSYNDHRGRSYWALPYCCHIVTAAACVEWLHWEKSGNRPSVCITFPGHQVLNLDYCAYTVCTPQNVFVANIYMTKISLQHVQTDMLHMFATNMCMLDAPENVMQSVHFTVWKLALIYIKVHIWSFNLFGSCFLEILNTQICQTECVQIEYILQGLFWPFIRHVHVLLWFYPWKMNPASCLAGASGTLLPVPARKRKVKQNVTNVMYIKYLRSKINKMSWYLKITTV